MATLVLLFAGIATKFSTTRIRIAILVTGVLILAAGLPTVGSLPLTSG